MSYKTDNQYTTKLIKATQGRIDVLTVRLLKWICVASADAIRRIERKNVVADAWE